MSLADSPRGVALGGGIPRPSDLYAPQRHPPHDSSLSQTKIDALQAWFDIGLQSRADRREFARGRYQITFVRTGADYARALDNFRSAVADQSRTAFLAVFAENTQCSSAEDELHVLGAALRDAGLTDDPLGLIEGRILSMPIEVTCPVTGKDTFYEFFTAALCQNAANPDDPLYDPARSAPFTAVKTTSEALAFAHLVDEMAMQEFQRPVHEMTRDRNTVEALFRRSIAAWQDLWAATITSHGPAAVNPARSMQLSEDRRHWYAAHNEPAFAELTKCPFRHEMPTTYAARLAAKWSANLFAAKPYLPSHVGDRRAARRNHDRLVEQRGRYAYVAYV